MSDDVLVSVFAHTDIGMHRSGNEDAFLVADLTTGNSALGSEMSAHRVGERGSLLVVSDGMGGAAAGEVASEMAVTTICERLMSAPADLDAAEKLKRATEAANDRIWDYARANSELFGMGATVTAVLLHGANAYVSQVGDSRAYLIRGDRIKQLTKDQSLVQLLVDSGAIMADQAEAVPQNVIMQALGTQPNVKVVLTGIALCRDDHLLICSDGLSNKIKPEEMLDQVQRQTDLSSVCRSLIHTANERGGEDNITVILARFDGDALHSISESRSITGSMRALSHSYFHEAIAGSTVAAAQEPFEEESSKEPEDESAEPDSTTEPAESEPGPADLPNEYRESETFSDDFFRRPSAPRRLSYAPVLVMAIISLLLVAAVSYFFYSFYLKQPAQDAPRQR